MSAIIKDIPRLTKVQELVYEMRVGDAAKKKIITAGPATLMSELRHILRDNRISGLPVVEHDRLLGIISLDDFIRWLADDRHDCPVRDKMTRNVQVLYEDEPLIHAVNMFDRTGFGRFPVVDRKSGKLVGVITKGAVIEQLLQKLEIEYHEEEIHRYRASHIFEDIIADQTRLVFRSHVLGKDFDRAGKVSGELKKTLTRLGIHPDFVRRAAIVSYEAEMNLVIYTEGGDVEVAVDPQRISIDVTDGGPGIPDVALARQPGYSTAPEWVRELGFGAGMGLCNIEKCSDKMDLTSTVGVGTHLAITIETTNPSGT